MRKTAKVKFLKIDNDTNARDVRGYRDATNIRNGLGATIKAVSPIKGVDLNDFTLPTGTNITIGSVENKQKQTIIYFIRNTLGSHQIIEYNPRNNTHLVLYRWQGFNWIPGHFIHSAVIIDGRYLIFTDAFYYGIGAVVGNEVRKLDTTRATHPGLVFQYDVYIEGDVILANTEWAAEYYNFDGTLIQTIPFTPLLAGTLYQRVSNALLLIPFPDTIASSIVGGNYMQILATSPGTRLRIVSTPTDPNLPYNRVVTIARNHYPDANQDILTLINRMPESPLEFEYINDGSIIYNEFQEDVFQFTYRFKYRDNSVSAWGTWHTAAFPFDPARPGYLKLDYNAIKIKIPEVYTYDPVFMSTISSIEIGFKRNNDYFNTLGDFPLHRFYNGDGKIVFTNYGIHPLIPSDATGLPDQQVLKNFDTIPIRANSLELVSEEQGATLLALCGGTYGYDNISVNAQVSYRNVVIDDEPDETILKALDDTEGMLNLTHIKKGGKYKWGIVYADHKGRRSAVQIIGESEVPHWYEGANYSVELPRITISHQAPSWATHYYIVRSDNLIHARYFQRRGEVAADNPYGVFDLQSKTFTPTAYGDSTHQRIVMHLPYPSDVISDITLIAEEYQQQQSIYFLPETGDRIRFHGASIGIPTSDFYFPILFDLKIDGYEISSEYIYEGVFSLILYVKTWTNINFKNILCEVYTPNKVDLDIWYDVAMFSTMVSGLSRLHVGNVQNQGFSVPAIVEITKGGDTYWSWDLNPEVKPNDNGGQVAANWWRGAFGFAIETESPFWQIKSKVKAVGRPNTFNMSIRQSVYNRIWVSEIYVPDSSINGISSFRDDSYIDINRDFGRIAKAVMVGEVLLIICNNRIQPIYIGKGRVVDMSGRTIIGRSSEIFSLANELKETYGTQHPATVWNENNHVYGWDEFRGIVWRYSVNGLIPISSQGKERDFANISKFRRNVLNVNNYAFGCYDRMHNQYVLYLSPLSGQPYQCWMYQEGVDEIQGWICKVNWDVDCFGRLGRDVYSWKAGKLYKHEQDNVPHNFFHGVQYTSDIKFTFNDMPDVKKLLDGNIRVESNKLWHIAELLSPPSQEYPNGQRSRVKSTKFVSNEGSWFAEFMRDVLDTSKRFRDIADPVERESNALIYGRPIRCNTVDIKLELLSNQYTELFGVDIEYVISHQTKE